MSFARKEYDLRIVNINDPVRKQINVDGVYQVLTAGSPFEQTIYVNNQSASAGSNPGTIVDGQIRFFVDSSVASVDIIIYTSDGDAVFMQGVKSAGSIRNVVIDTNKREQLLPIILTTADGAETGTGFTPVGPVLITDIELFVTTLYSSKTIDIGFGGSGANNDPDALIEGASVNAAGYVELGGDINDSSPDYFDAIVYGDGLVSKVNGTSGANTVGGAIRHKVFIAEDETAAEITFTVSDTAGTLRGYAFVHLTKLPT